MWNVQIMTSMKEEPIYIYIYTHIYIDIGVDTGGGKGGRDRLV